MIKMIKILLPVDIIKGLYLTGKNFIRVLLSANHSKTPKHVVSEYPEVIAKIHKNFRGRLTLLKDDSGNTKCIGCLACEKICPTNAITIETGNIEGRKTKIPIVYNFEMERCTFCGLCVESCKFSAICLNQQFELAAYNREDFSIGIHGHTKNLFQPTETGKFNYSND